MSKVHCVGGHSSDQTTGFAPVGLIALYGVVMSLERLRQYCGTGFRVTLRDSFLSTRSGCAALGACGSICPKTARIQSGLGNPGGRCHILQQQIPGPAHRVWHTIRPTQADRGASLATVWNKSARDRSRNRQIGHRDNHRPAVFETFVIDLSTAAARLLGMMRGGLTQVQSVARPDIRARAVP